VAEEQIQIVATVPAETWYVVHFPGATNLGSDLAPSPAGNSGASSRLKNTHGWLAEP